MDRQIDTRVSEGPSVNDKADLHASTMSLQELAERLQVPNPDRHNFPLESRGVGPEAYLGEKL